MYAFEISAVVPDSANSTKTTLAANTPYTYTPPVAYQGFDCYFLVTVKADTCVRQGVPGGTCTSDGTDMTLLANNQYRLGPLPAGRRLYFNSLLGGELYITPNS